MPLADTPSRAIGPGAADHGVVPPPILWDDSVAGWRVQGHAAARAILLDHHLDVTRDPAPPPLGDDRVPSAMEFLSSWFSRSSGDRHRSVRRHIARPYSEASVAALEDVYRTAGAECVARLQGDFDLISDFLRPFWLRGTAAVLGAPEGELERLGKVVSILSEVLALPRMDDRGERAVAGCIRYLRALLGHLVSEDEPSPTVRVLRELSVDRAGGGVWTAVAVLAQILTAGLHPTLTGAALAWRSLHSDPLLLAGTREGSVDTADLVEEVLRLHPPFPFIHRWAQTRCDCHGAVLETGAHVLVDLRAANRDPEVFDLPDDIVAGRDRALHLTFGHGAHRCLGLALARLQIRVALRMLLSLDPPVRPVEPDPRLGTDDSGHLVVVRSLPCRREAGSPGSPATAGPPHRSPESRG